MNTSFSLAIFLLHLLSFTMAGYLFHMLFVDFVENNEFEEQTLDFPEEA
jgi:hypothetical protein